jgi:hypothetical protein
MVRGRSRNEEVRNMRRRVGARPRPAACALAAALIVLGAAPAASAEPSELDRAPGYIDGSPFLALSTEDSELVEISIKGALLQALSRGVEDAETTSLFAGLKGINAVIAGLDHDPARTERAIKLVRDTGKRLDQSGWERLARVRDRGSDVGVFIRSGPKTIDGLVVLAFNQDESKVVFVNIVGAIDLAKIGEIGSKLEVPGLEAIPKDGKRTPVPEDPE